MLVELVASKSYFSHSDTVKRKENRHSDSDLRTNASFGHADTYIKSNSLNAIKSSDDNKAKDLSEVKKRIASGFYDSSAVNDDLTEAFSQIFKKAFS